MKDIVIDLGSELEQVKIIPLSDTHIGSPHCKYGEIQRRVKLAQDNPDVYLILNGDLINNSVRDSVGDTYTEELTPEQQIDKCIELLSPVKDKILSITTGNHERRTYRKHGIDPTAFIARGLDLLDRYDPVGCLLYLKFGSRKYSKDTTSDTPNKNIGDKILYTIYHTHGDGNGGKTLGGKVNGVERRTNIVDADIIMCGHTHQSFITYESRFRINRSTCKSYQHHTMLVNTDATIGYEGYAETVGMKPSAIKVPIIVLSGTHHNMTGVM